MNINTVILGGNDEIIMLVDYYPYCYDIHVETTGRFKVNTSGEYIIETKYKIRKDSILNEFKYFFGYPWYKPTLIDRFHWVHENDVLEYEPSISEWGEIQNCH